MANQMYESVGRLFGRNYIRRLGSFLDSGGYVIAPEAVAGIFVVACLAATFIFSSALLNMNEFKHPLFKLALFAFRPLVVASSGFIVLLASVLAACLAFGIGALVFYLVVKLQADTRRQKVEDALPDFLVLAASNVRAGMTIDQALWYAAKPEFGLLSAEVQVVAKQTFGGVPFAKSLDYLPSRFESKIIRRTVSLIKQGLASGGRLAEILERTAQDARDMQIIRREIAASLLMYIIFIVFCAALGTPFLFAVSSKLIVMLEHVFAQLPDTSETVSMGGSSFMTPQPPIVTSEQFYMFVLASSFVTALCSALMIGAIQHGNKREGFRYLPFIVFVGLVVFFAISIVLDTFIGGLGGGMAG